MSACVIVPAVLEQAIYRAVDAQLEKHPSLLPERENIFRDILGYFHEHGHIPDFELKPTGIAAGVPAEVATSTPASTLTGAE